MNSTHRHPRPVVSTFEIHAFLPVIRHFSSWLPAEMTPGFLKFVHRLLLSFPQSLSGFVSPPHLDTSPTIGDCAIIYSQKRRPWGHAKYTTGIKKFFLDRWMNEWVYKWPCLHSFLPNHAFPIFHGFPWLKILFCIFFAFKKQSKFYNFFSPILFLLTCHTNLILYSRLMASHVTMWSPLWMGFVPAFESDPELNSGGTPFSQLLTSQLPGCPFFGGTTKPPTSELPCPVYLHICMYVNINFKLLPNQQRESSVTAIQKHLPEYNAGLKTMVGSHPLKGKEGGLEESQIFWEDNRNCARKTESPVLSPIL